MKKISTRRKAFYGLLAAAGLMAATPFSAYVAPDAQDPEQYTVNISQAVMDRAGAKPKWAGLVSKVAANARPCNTQAQRKTRRAWAGPRRRMPSAGTA